MIHPDAPDPSLTIEGLKSVLNGALLRHTFSFSRTHANDRSAVRNITFEDVVHICQVGKFKREPRYENHNWKYEIKGKDLDGEVTTVILAVDDNKYRVTVVTFF